MEVRKVLMNVTWREVRCGRQKEAQRHPKLEMVGSLIEQESEGRGLMVKCKRRRRLVKLREELHSWGLRLEDGVV